MPASAALLTDAGTMITNGASAATTAKAIAAGGPITDYLGMLDLYQKKVQELKVFLTAIKNATDAGDGNLTTINNGLLTLV